MKFSLLIDMKMPTVVGIFVCISREKSMQTIGIFIFDSRENFMCS